MRWTALKIVMAILVLAVAGEGAILKFDFGKTGSPVFEGFLPVDENTKYSPEKGFGWVWIKQLQAHRDDEEIYWAPDPLLMDWVRAEATFAVDLPEGDYVVHFIIRDIAGKYDSERIVWIACQGKDLYKFEATGEGFNAKYTYRHLATDYDGRDVWDKYVEPAYKRMTFPCRVEDGKLSITFLPADVVGLVIASANEKDALDKFLEDLVEKEREFFPYREGRYAVGEGEPFEGDFCVFSVNYMEKIYYYTPPHNIGRPLQGFATQGEIEPMAFAIYTKEGLRKLKVSVGPFVGRGGAIIDESNIKVYTVRYSEIRHWASNTYYVEPRVLQKRAEVDIPAGTTKEFIIDVQVPEDAEPGVYKGRVSVIAGGKNLVSLPLELEVLPFALHPLKDKYQGVFHFYFSIHERYGLVEEAVKDLIRSGYNLIWTGARVLLQPEPTGMKYDFTGLAGQLDFYRELGFAGSKAPFFVLQGGLRDVYRLTGITFDDLLKGFVPENFKEYYGQTAKAIKDWARRHGWEDVLIYEVGEPTNFGEAGMKDALFRSKILKEAGVKTLATINGPACMRLLPYIDVAAANEGMRISEEFVKALKEMGVELWLYNLDCNPRFARGVYLWRSGARACVKEGYILPDADQYNEFGAVERQEWGYWPVWWDVRPAPGEVVPTLQWLWAREGIDDAKYIQTLFDLIEEAKKKGRGVEEAKRAEEFINRVFKSMPLEMQLYTKCGMGWEPESYAGFRRRIAHYICALLEELGK